MKGWFVRSLLSAALLIMANNIIRPVISYRALELGASPSQLGLIAASYAALAFLIAIPVGRWIDRFRQGLFLLAGASFTVAIAFALPMIDTLFGLSVAQALLGGSEVCSFVSVQAIIASGGTAERRDGRFGFFSVAVSLGQMAGPAVAGLVVGSSTLDTVQGFIVAGLIGLPATLLGLSLVIRPPTYRDPRLAGKPSSGERLITTVGRVMRVPSMPQAMAASLSVLASIDVLIAYLPALGEARGIAASTVGFLLATRAGASLAVRMLMLPLIRMMGRRRLLFLSLIAPAISLFAVPFVGTNVPLLFLLMAVAGLGLGVGQPMTVSWIAGRAPADARATALAVRVTGNRLGQLTVPLVVGLAAGVAGIGAVFFTLTAMLGGSAALVFRAELDDSPT